VIRQAIISRSEIGFLLMEMVFLGTERVILIHLGYGALDNFSLL